MEIENKKLKQEQKELIEKINIANSRIVFLKNGKKELLEKYNELFEKYTNVNKLNDFNNNIIAQQKIMIKLQDEIRTESDYQRCYGYY